METARQRVLDAASALLDRGGRDAVTTRAVSAAADVTEPTIYRLFGDKAGLLDAVAEYGLTAYVNRKSAKKPAGDPVDDLRAGWDRHVDFGLTNPEVFLLMYGDPRRAVASPASAVATEVLHGLIGRIAAAGRLTVGESHAAELVHSVSTGVILTLIGQPDSERDLSLSTTAREALLTVITTETPLPAAPGPVAAAVTLRAGLPDTDVFTASERALLTDWLDRIIERPSASPKTLK